MSLKRSFIRPLPIPQLRVAIDTLGLAYHGKNAPPDISPEHPGVGFPGARGLPDLGPAIPWADVVHMEPGGNPQLTITEVHDLMDLYRLTHEPGEEAQDFSADESPHPTNDLPKDERLALMYEDPEVYWNGAAQWYRMFWLEALESKKQRGALDEAPDWLLKLYTQRRGRLK